MGFFARSWLDRLLGRRGDKPGAEGERASSFDEQAAAREPDSAGGVEEDVTATRSDTVTRQAPMPPPGTG